MNRGATVTTRSLGAALVLLLLVLCSALLVSSSPAADQRITIYSPATNYSLTVIEHNNRDYVGLLEMLEPLGRVAARIEGPRWKLRFKGIDAQFVAGSSRARIGRREVDLGGPFVLQNSRGLVPVDSLATLLPQFLGSPVTLHASAHRLFIGEQGTTYSAELTKTTPAKLVLNFTAPVNPTIHTEAGKVSMLFVRDPLIASGAATVNFNDKGIGAAAFQENNGAAEITVTGTSSLMASFSNNGRTITIAAAPSVAAAQTATTAPPSTPQVPPAAPNMSPQPAPEPRFVVAIDPSHGGDERGAAFADNLLEKDITLALARRIRVALDARGVSTLLLRDSDNTLSPDQRAAAANSGRVSLYVGIHASNDGTGLRVFTPLLATAGDDRGAFVSWDAAQARALPISQSTAAAFASTVSKTIPTRVLTAPLRPLSNISSPALSIEIAPRTLGTVADLNSPDYQQMVANAVASAIAASRANLGGGQ